MIEWLGRRLQQLLGIKGQPCPPEPKVEGPTKRGWMLESNHTIPERAHILAEIAFMDFANDRLGLIQRAAWRIADALAKYEVIDNEKAGQ